MTLPDVTQIQPIIEFSDQWIHPNIHRLWSANHNGLCRPLQIWGLTYGQNYDTYPHRIVYRHKLLLRSRGEGNCPIQQLMVLNSTNGVDWSRLYVMEFSPYPNGLSTFINQPHFDGIPMPSIYQGMSLAELTNVQATLPNLSFLIPSNYLTLDASPELRRHPILDQFVKNMGNDPMALANYVINEVGLIDGIDYNTNYTYQTTVNLGGVNRSALDTFQEGQGSPMEQCALLVYLLRQAGVPAAYVFPTNSGMQMLSSQMSKLLPRAIDRSSQYMVKPIFQRCSMSIIRGWRLMSAPIGCRFFRG